MRDLLKLLFNDKTDQIEYNIDNSKKLQIATCAIFIEVANADEDFSSKEKSLIITLMKEIFNLSDIETEELISLSEEEIKESVSLYEFTEIVDAHLNYNEKIQIIENLWRLILVDDKLHQYEDYFIRKVVNNLHLSHADMIDAKLKIKEEKDREGNTN